jgi:hypothetical protein
MSTKKSLPYTLFLHFEQNKKSGNLRLRLFLGHTDNGVVSQHSSPHHPTELDQFEQVAFKEPSHYGLGIPCGVDLKRWATHLAHLSAREPENLLNHVRRIYLHLTLHQADELYGAMLDLHLVLGNKGSNLRSRLLRDARKLLPRERYDIFLKHYKQGLQRNQSLPPSRHSVSGNFFSGKMMLVKQITKSTEQTSQVRIDPILQAREELNYGDVATAQRILEDAILWAPEQVELHLELLEIYLATRSLSDLKNMQERLGDGVIVARQAWNQTRSALEN